MGLLDGTTQQEYYQGSDHGNYQFTSLDDIITQFMVVYVGEGKLITKVKRTEVAFHAQRAMQELSFDTFKSCKSQEITLPPSLQMTLPQDYVNYTKVSWIDSAGIKHLLYPTSKTSNPPNPLQDSNGDFILQAVGTMSTATNQELVVLDAEYKDIVVGMRVSAPNIPDVTSVSSVIDGVFVGSTSNTSSITTIGLVDDDGVDVDVTYTGTETLTFENADGSLIREQESAFILENVTFEDAGDKITQAPNTDVSNIKVGMLVSHELFKAGTTVIDVNGAVITTSNDALGFSGGGTAAVNDEVTFILAPRDSDTWSNYKSQTPNENNQDDYNDNSYWTNNGERYGLDPQHAQANGSFYMVNARYFID